LISNFLNWGRKRKKADTATKQESAIAKNFFFKKKGRKTI